MSLCHLHRTDNHLNVYIRCNTLQNNDIQQKHGITIEVGELTYRTRYLLLLLCFYISNLFAIFKVALSHFLTILTNTYVFAKAFNSVKHNQMHFCSFSNMCVYSYVATKDIMQTAKVDNEVKFVTFYGDIGLHNSTSAY